MYLNNRLKLGSNYIHIYRIMEFIGTLTIIIILLITSCSFACNKGEKVGKDVIINNYFKKVEYSASPRLSIEYCKKILEIDPNNAEAHYKLAEAYSDMADIVLQKEEEKEYYRNLAVKHFDIAKRFGIKPEKANDGKKD